MVSTVEQKVEYLNKLIDSNNETAKNMKDNLERLEVLIFIYVLINNINNLYNFKYI